MRICLAVALSASLLAGCGDASRDAQAGASLANVDSGGVRVTADLQVLYDFSSGSGSTVLDVSDVGVPMDLTIQDPANTQWIDGGGLSVTAPTVIDAADGKIAAAAMASNAITLEAWIYPANTSQSGPARIVTLSKSSSSRNATLGQDRSRYQARVRTTTAGRNGVKPFSQSASGAAETVLSHVVYTRSADGTATIYRDGVEVDSNTVGGDLSNWDPSHAFALANELTRGRPFLGDFYLVAVYARALSIAEVQQNFDAGLGGASTGGTSDLPAADAGPDQTLTDLDARGDETVVLDGSGSFDDGVIVSYEWQEGGVLVGSGVSPALVLSVGEHTLTLIVTDDDGQQASDTVVVTVLPFVDSTPPTVPVVQAMAVSESRVDLTWTASSDDESGVDSYNVYRDGGLVDSVTGTLLMDTGLATFTEYTYRVSAVNGAGLESALSAPAVVMTLADSVAPVVDAVSVGADGAEVTVFYDEATDVVSAETLANYAIDPGVVITSAVLSPDQLSVTLSLLSPLLSGALYSLTVSGVTDLAGNVLVEHMGDIVYSASPAAIMPLGDSITQANADHNSYRRPLWFALQDAGYNVDFVGSRTNHRGADLPPNPDFDMDHEGHWSSRADQLAGNLPAWLELNVPDIVLLHAGTNDLGQGQSIATTLSDISEIINTLRAYNLDVVVLLAQIIPRLGAAYIEPFNSALIGFAAGESTLQSPVIIVDQFTGFDAAFDTYDGVHPNAQGEGKMAGRWFSALQAVLDGSASQQPVADAGPDQTVTDVDASGDEVVVLDGSGSFDDGVIVFYEWSEGGVLVGSGVSPALVLSVGEHTLTLIVTDDEGQQASDTVVVTVLPFVDSTPPTVPDVTAMAVSESQVDLIWTVSSDDESGVDSYNVYRDGGSVDSVTGTQLMDTGLATFTEYTYRVSAVNGAGLESALSAPAVVTTLADSVAPVVDAVVVGADGAEITVQYDEAMDLVTAETLANYAIDPGVVITAAGLSPDQLSVTLSFSSPLLSGVSYSLTVSGVTDLAGNVLVEHLEDFVYLENGRVTADLQVLYDFSSGTGSTVLDVSSVGVPMDLTIQDPANTQWIAGGGLSVTAPTVIDAADGKIAAAAMASNAITLEAWVRPANTSQSGPARIVTLSKSSSSRNATLGQDRSRYQARVRTTTTGRNGVKPFSQSASGSAETVLSHVVYSRSADGTATIYRDGVEVGSNTVGGDFSNWDPSHAFALANELTLGRPFLGDFHLVAVYARALSIAEVQQNFDAGPPGGSTTP